MASSGRTCLQGWGTSTVNFGAFPGSSNTSLAVTGQSGIASDAIVQAWIYPTATADHTADEHVIDPPFVFAGNVVAGTGFTLYGLAGEVPVGIPDYTVALEKEKINLRTLSAPVCPLPVGTWTVAWTWRNSI